MKIKPQHFATLKGLIEQVKAQTPVSDYAKANPQTPRQDRWQDDEFLTAGVRAAREDDRRRKLGYCLKSALSGIRREIAGFGGILAVWLLLGCTVTACPYNFSPLGHRMNFGNVVAAPLHYLGNYHVVIQWRGVLIPKNVFVLNAPAHFDTNAPIHKYKIVAPLFGDKENHIGFSRRLIGANHVLRSYLLPKSDDNRSKQGECLHYANYNQPSCKGLELPLYIEVLASLLANFIAGWGGCLFYGRPRRRILGSVIAIFGLCLYASILTTILFCDPLFLRAEWRSFTGGDPYRCQWSDHSEYR